MTHPTTANFRRAVIGAIILCFAASFIAMARSQKVAETPSPSSPSRTTPAAIRQPLAGLFGRRAIGEMRYCHKDQKTVDRVTAGVSGDSSKGDALCPQVQSFEAARGRSSLPPG